MSRQKVLVIDDSIDIQELVVLWLADENLEFYCSSAGTQGLADAHQISPDLILLDVDLPDFDGFTVCQRLKADPVTASIPIVFLTGAASTEEKLRGLELGADDYVVKPFDPAELRARVRSSLNSKRLMDQLAQKALFLQESEERFRVLAENSSDAISRHSADGVYLYASPACVTILGYEPGEIMGRSVFEFVHAEDRPAVQAYWATPRRRGETGNISFRFSRKDGQVVWLELTCRTITDKLTGHVREVHASARDITARKQMEFREELRADVLEQIAQGKPLNDILHHLIAAAEKQTQQAIAAGVMLSGLHLCHCAPRLPQPISYSIERQAYRLIEKFGELSSKSASRILTSDLDIDPIWSDQRLAFEEHQFKSSWSVLITSRHRDAAGVFTLYSREKATPDASTMELMKLISDLTGIAVEHRQLNDQLTFQARHDALTQLPNRVMFSDRLEQALAASRRGSRCGAVLLVDIDRFKHVNDTYGHQVGDEMLCQVAHRLGRRLRQTDVLARMGGDEFALILVDMMKAEDAQLVAQSLVDEFKTPLDLLGRKFFTSVSIGSATFPADGTDAGNLLKNADLALYRAKDAGRNTSRSYTPDMGEGSIERVELESALRQAVPNHELCLHYQPKVNPDGRIVGLEALVRWQHPVLGMIPPAKFIPLAEDSGLILQIGCWVLEEAARQTRRWMEMGLDCLPIAVNVSTVQFTQPEFIRSVTDVLVAVGVDQSWLELELTETLLMMNMFDAADKLSRLKELKVRVAIDDFGTGYSSLAYLQRLAIDMLKIDQSFVRTLSNPKTGESGRKIIDAIISLAKSLGLKVVAEGVETEHERSFLCGLGVDMMQGYLFGRPLPAAAIEPLLRQQQALAIALAA